MIKKVGLYVIFICSIGLFLVASFFFYNEYISYKERVKRYTKPNSVNIKDSDNYNFTNVDVNTLESFREQRNNLLGYETFLKESMVNYNPESFSYANILKDNFITQLDNIKFSQKYWDKLITSFYTYNSSGKSTSLEGYDALMRIPSTYINEDITGDENEEIIEKIATEEYWKRAIFQFDRSTKNIKDLWKNNKAFFYTFMSKSKYDKHSKNVITDLVEVYNKVTQEPNYKEFYKIHNVNDSIFHTFPSAKYVNSFNYSWPFSFWDRRFEEKNDTIIYEILTEIKNHYEN